MLIDSENIIVFADLTSQNKENLSHNMTYMIRGKKKANWKAMSHCIIIKCMVHGEDMLLLSRKPRNSLNSNNHRIENISVFLFIEERITC